MKIKTSISISNEVLEAVDRFSKPSSNRSEFIENAIKRFVEQLMRERQNASDLAILNRNAKRLNAQAASVLDYQVLP